MSEKIYSYLLRLYPAHFRQKYGDEALELFRDRLREERGFFLRVRLWLDLLADLATSIPRQHRYAPATLATNNHPAFRILQGDAPRIGPFLLGGALTLAIASASVPITRISTAHRVRLQVPTLVRPSPPPSAAELDPAARQLVIEATVANLNRYYVNPALAQKMIDAIRTHQTAGDYRKTIDATAFADLLTKHMRDVSHDLNLIVVYSKAPRPERPPTPSPESLARYKNAMLQSNCMFEKAELLPHGIGYLKLNFFPDTSICQSTAVAAMEKLNIASAIIFDLRDNTGGFPNMVALLAAYLFDHPEYWYNPRENTTEESWTHSPVPGNKLADKPVYILTSSKTSSGAEQFTYDLKMLKRATIVGETTAGAAHAAAYHQIDEHFGIGITEARAINPFSKQDWGGTGVAPDVKVTAAEALATARRLAEKKWHQ